MGPVVSTVETVGDVVTNTKRYYDCPGCGRRVWAYGAFEGNTCWECPGTLVDAAVRTADHATTGGLIRSRDGGLVGAISGLTSPDKCEYLEHSIDSSDYNQKIKEIRVRSVWIGHGALSAPASLISGTLTQNPTTHWWVEIETESRWYCAQFFKPDLELSYHSSLSEVTEQGKAAANCRGESKEITNKYTHRPSNRSIREVSNWMREYNENYDIVSNNCQKFATAFYHWI